MTEEQVKRVFQRALERPVLRREPFLDRVCGRSGPLRARVDALLRAHEGPFLSEPTGGAPIPCVPEELPGAVIGPYRLLEVIGEGGFGVVYVAEQSEPVRRRVALKLVRPGMETREVLARFEAERQALALMDHPNIARVLDGGATAAGRPYFVMELVRGIPISTYCDQCQLVLRERLALFVQVCRAVQHAHQKGVIHRDLKPSNVLVAMQDGIPSPKVIDFGVAKATGLRLTEEIFHTRFAQMIGTPQYMSPEQAEMSALDVDTRSDVYSLGVVLYELLTGTTPLAAGRLSKVTFDELRRIIREEDPPTPSGRLTSLNGDGARVAAARRTDLRRLVRVVHGDLDWIVMRALEKDRTRRYDTVAALAAEVERYLRDEPVEARPPSAWYRFRKFVRRRRGPVVAAALFFAALVAGVVGTTLGLVRALAAESEAEAQRSLAEEEAAIAQAVNDFLRNDLLRQADVGCQPDGSRDPDVKVRTLLDRAAASVEGKFAGQPRTEAALRSTLGETYSRLGLYAEAERHLTRSIDIHKALAGSDHPETLALGSALATVYAEQGRYPEAEALYLEALRAQAAGRGTDPRAILVTKDALAGLYADQGRYDEAEVLYRETVRALAETLGERHEDTCVSKSNLAGLFWERGKYELAEDLLREVLEAGLGEDHPHTLGSMQSLARIQYELGRYDQAEALYRETLAAMAPKLGATHPATLFCKANLALLYLDQGRYDVAEALYVEVVAARTDALGPDHPYTLEPKCGLALLYKMRGDHHLAGPLYREVLEAQTAALGAGHQKTLTTKNNLAGLYRAERQYGEAERLLREVLEASSGLGPHHPDLLRTKENLALVCKDQGRFESGEPLLLEVLEARTAVFGPRHRDTLGTKHNLADLYKEQGRHEEAEALYEEVLLASTATLGPDDPDTLGTMNSLGALCLARGERDRAATLLREAAGHALPAWGSTHPLTLAILLNLVGCLEEMGRPAEAEPFRREIAEARKRRAGADSTSHAAELAALGLNLLKQGKHAEAEEVLRACVAIREAKEPERWATFNARSMLGAALLGLQRHAEAEPLLLQGYEGMKAREADIPAGVRATRLIEAQERLVQLYEDRSLADEAQRWRREIERHRPAAERLK